DSASGLTIDYNIYNRSGAVQVIDHEGDREYTLAEWQFQGQDRHSNSFLPQLIFAAPGSDFHLGNGSNGINRGLNVGVAYDFEGDARPQGTAPDIGADEYK
ncbi:MAG: hypothetical protein GY765_37300, partial [bacterium]|nr:hypothetical protein [bacterium]